MKLIILALVFLMGCAGPVLKKDCRAIEGGDERSCKGDSTSKGCVFVPEKDNWVCDK